MTTQTGLLLVNLGSPDAPTAAAVRPYLFEFLHDKRVIDTSRWIWCPILHGIILRFRPAKSAKLYAKIWDQPDGKAGGEAPLVRITRAQTAGVQRLLGDKVHVETAMRYGNPSIDLGFDRLLAKGCTHIAVLPLYPQFAGATTASVYDGVAKALKRRMNVPDVRLLRDYHDDKRYIDLIAKSITDKIGQQGWEPDAILASFHGMPQSYVDKGDPYQSECETTVRLLKGALGDRGAKLQLTFQSRFGPKQWLQPYTDVVLEDMAKAGQTKVMVITPGFAADCLETLEEINMESRQTFLSAGGEKFGFVPCLNADQAHVGFLTDLAKERLLSGWL